jgi:hypothetical protein
VDKRQVHETINKLVEARYDQRSTQTRLREFQEANEPRPLPPSEFSSLQEFLDFYGRHRDYQNTINNLDTEHNDAMRRYDEAKVALSRVLPQNVPLYYTYEGERQELSGWQFSIVNIGAAGQGQINIRSTRP